MGDDRRRWATLAAKVGLVILITFKKVDEHLKTIREVFGV